MATYALINTQNIVTNVVEWDGTSNVQFNGTPIEVQGPCSIGWQWDGESFSKVPPTPEEIKKQFNVVREKRDAKLLASDWTQLSDVPLTEEKKIAWVTYRQELRDFMEHLIDPFNPIWPNTP